MLGLQNEREWQVFCARVLDRPELAGDPRFASNSARTAARDVLRGLIVAAFASLSTAQVVERLDAAQIANARVNTMAEVWAHPQLRTRSRWTEVDSPSGPIPALLPPGSHDIGEVRMDAVPAVGQHTDALLAEVGFDAAAIAGLRRAGAV